MKSNKSKVEIQAQKKFYKSLAVGLGVALLGAIAFAAIEFGPTENELPWVLRKAHQLNEKVFHSYFRETRLAPEFPSSPVTTPRPNGDEGLQTPIDLKAWRLQAFAARSTRPIQVTIEEIRALPVYEETTQFKCIEGWSNITHWKGARLSDFIAKYRLDPSGPSPYVDLETPDHEYFVGLDMDTAIHPQTLLAYEMNGKPLTLEHGAPLRLVTPLKYGIKQIKRIGSIKILQQRPEDYWAEQGYDWYSGH